MKNDYKVGYCKPPGGTRFVKEKSGNPNGRPPRCLPAGRPVRFGDILMKELDSPIMVVEGGRPRKISKQRALIKEAVNRAINGSTRDLANLFRLIRKHRVNLNDDCDSINIVAERLDFVQELWNRSSTSWMVSGLSIEQKLRFMEEFLGHGVAYLTGKLRLAADHPLNIKPRAKMRPSTAIADDLLFELRETINVTEGGKKSTVTKLEALVKRLLNDAILGNGNTAFSLLLELYNQYGWDKEDNSVYKLAIDSKLAEFIGLKRGGRAGSRPSGRSKRLSGDSGQDGRASGAIVPSADS